MSEEYKIIREYFAVDDMNQSETISVLPLALVDMLLDYKRKIKKLHKHVIIARFLNEIAKQHNEDANKVMVGLQFGDLHVWRYDTGAYQVWKTLKVIPKNAL